MKEGILRDMTTPHNPQHNGVDERKNHKIVGGMRAMLHDEGLPLYLWVEECYIIFCLKN